MTLRVIAAVVVWVTVVGGLVLAVRFFARGGAHAIGPEDETLAQQGGFVQSRSDRVTSFSGSHVGLHGVFGLLTACLLTYAVARGSDRQTGYVAALVALAATAALGLELFRRWVTGRRPRVEGAAGVGRVSGERVEDRLPRAVVYGHGLAAAATVLLVVVMLAIDA